MNATANKVVYNELNENIVSLHKMFLENSAECIDSKILEYIKDFDLNVEGEDVKQNSPDTIDTREKYNDNYLRFREAYNKSQNDACMLYTLTFYSFSNLIRFNSNNEFNMPYGNHCYTQEHRQIIKYWCDLIHKKNIELLHKDAFDILEELVNSDNLNPNTFVYNDPPYSQTMAIYNEQRAFGGWGIEEDYKLFDYLEKLNDKGIKWGLSNVFRNKDFVNRHLIDWCEQKGWNVRHLDFTYSSLGKGNAHSDEVYICNYTPPIPEFKQTKLF